MPNYDYQCDSDACGTLFEAYLPLSDYQRPMTCPKCASPASRDWMVRERVFTTADPVVVYQAPDGSFRFPPDVTTASTAMYDKQGMTRIELRGWTDVRRFEKHFNESQMSEVRRRVERQAEAHERAESERRSEIRRCMEQGFSIPEIDDRGVATGRMQRVELSERGREIMRQAIAMNDRKGGPRSREVGFHVEAYSSDRSNRAPDPRRRGQ